MAAAQPGGGGGASGGRAARGARRAADADADVAGDADLDGDGDDDEDDGDIATREQQVNGGAARRGKDGGALRRLDVPGLRALFCFVFAKSYPQ